MCVHFMQADCQCIALIEMNDSDEFFMHQISKGLSECNVALCVVEQQAG